MLQNRPRRAQAKKRTKCERTTRETLCLRMSRMSRVAGIRRTKEYSERISTTPFLYKVGTSMLLGSVLQRRDKGEGIQRGRARRDRKALSYPEWSKCKRQRSSNV